jgi:hypothetical protein
MLLLYLFVFSCIEVIQGVDNRDNATQQRGIIIQNFYLVFKELRIKKNSKIFFLCCHIAEVLLIIIMYTHALFSGRITTGNNSEKKKKQCLFL